MARTPIGSHSIADRNQYAYFNSAINMWQREPLTKNNVTGNIINWSVPGPKDGALVAPNVGDVWYDHYFKTTVMMWNSAGIYATFWFRYVFHKQSELDGSSAPCPQLKLDTPLPGHLIIPRFAFLSS
jgi:hypothetical protein